MIETFTAFDFETSSGHVPCSIGIAQFKDGEPTKKFYSLIKPIELKFNKINSIINGIKLTDVMDKPEFHEIWDDIQHFFTDTVIVAHNASFDFSVLQKTLDFYNLKKPENQLFCTLELSRRFFRLSDYKLKTVSNHLKFPDFNHHNALDDAIACGEIFSHFLNTYDITDFDKKSKSTFRKVANTVTKRISLSNLSNNDLSSLFNNNQVAISGSFIHLNTEILKSIIIHNNGILSEQIDQNTNILIAGSNSDPAAISDAYNLELQIIYESDILDRLHAHTETSVIQQTQSQNLEKISPDVKLIRSVNLNNLTFVITGVFIKFTREEIKEIIESNGGRTATSISGKTDFLLAGDGMGPSKFEKATRLGVKIINEEIFIKMLEQI